MLFKETCLHFALSSILKGDTELHNLVKEELTTWLTKGIGLNGIVHRKDYLYAFSKAFYDEYKRSRDIARALSYMFWSVAADKYPNLAPSAELPQLMGYDGLLNVYKYICMALKRELV